MALWNGIVQCGVGTNNGFGGVEMFFYLQEQVKDDGIINGNNFQINTILI